MRVVDLSHLSVSETKLLNQISIGLKEDFHKLLENFHSNTDGSIFWMFSSIMSRNPYQSEIFLSICRVLLIQELANSNLGKFNVIIDDVHLYPALKRIQKKNGNCFEIECLNIKNGKNGVISKQIRDLAKITFRTLLQRFAKSSKRLNQLANRKDLVLIDTFILKNSFDSGKFIDRYYNNLLSFIGPDLRKKVFFVPTFLSEIKPWKVESLINNSIENFILKFDYLKLRDYLLVFKSLFSMSFPSNEFSIRDVNITEILNHDFELNKYDYSAFDAGLNFLFSKRLKESGVSLQLVIDWNENQPIDKGFVSGFYLNYPNVVIKGYQGFIISRDYNFYIQPTELEVKQNVIPSEISVVSRLLISEIKKYDKNVVVKVAPAFRFKSVFTNSNNEQIITSNEGKRILVALPIGVKDSISILKVIFPLLRKYHDLVWVLKPHPLLAFLELKSSEYWSESYEVFMGPFLDAINDSEVLVGNTSTVLLESIALGTPVVVIAPENMLLQNPIPKEVTSSLWEVAFDSYGVGTSIQKFISIQHKNPKKLIHEGKSLLGDLFEKPTEQGVNDFFNLG